MLNQSIVLVDLFIINITQNIYYFRFIFSTNFIFYVNLDYFFSGACSWSYHCWCLAETQALVCSVYRFLSCTFYAVIKGKKECGELIQYQFANGGNR